MQSRLITSIGVTKMFIERHEHYINGSTATRLSLDYLQYVPGQQMLINGRLPKSHGVSYLLARTQMKEIGDEMGFETLDTMLKVNELDDLKIRDSSELYFKIYRQCVERTKDLL